MQGTFRIPVNYYCTVLNMFNGHTKNFDRNLYNFAAVVSTKVLKEINLICLSTKIEYLRCNHAG